MHQYRVPPPALRLDPIATALMQMWQRPRPALHLQARGTNKARFQGILCYLDQPSDLPPGGADGRRVLLPSAVAATKLAQLRGMPLNVDSATLGDHDMQNAVGSIDRAWIDGNRLCIAGLVWDKNFGPLVDRLRQQQGSLGLSYELSNATIKDQHAGVWELTDWEWTGASCLLRSKAAYQHTSFAVAA